MIPRTFIDDLLQRIDIVDVIDKRLPLKKQGNNYVACCPFHQEKTPSFTVSQDKQFYHCFGCGQSGSAISFLMEYDRLGFVESIELLAAEIGIEVPRDESPKAATQRKHKMLLGDYLAKASHHYQLQLAKTSAAKSYLAQRDLPQKIIDKYGIGYAPQSWDFIQKQLATNHEQRLQLFKAGMLVEKKSGGYYDRFRQRIMFPIKNSRGNIIGFGGRVIDASLPKYLNSPETTLFQKSHELYGLYEANQDPNSRQNILVVEGYMDVVSLAAKGINNVVASLGTSCTSMHIERLLRSSEKVTFCFDGDKAGNQAAWRALENALPILQDGKTLQFLFVPEGEDPDSLIRKEGSAAFLERVQNAKLLSDFLLDKLLADNQLQASEDFAKLVHDATPLIDKIVAPTLKLLLKSTIAKKLGTTVEHLFKNEPNSSPVAAFLPQKQPVAEQMVMSMERLLIAALLQEPQLALNISDKELDIVENYHQSKSVQFLIKLIDIIKQDGNLSSIALLERFRGENYEPELKQLYNYQFVEADHTSANKSNIKAITFNDGFKKILHAAKKTIYNRLWLKPKHLRSKEEIAFMKNFHHQE